MNLETYTEMMSTIEGVGFLVQENLKSACDNCEYEKELKPKIYMTLESLLTDYNSEEYLQDIILKDKGQELDYDKHILTFTHKPLTDDFIQLENEYNLLKESLVINRDKHTFTDKFYKMTKKDKKDSLASLEDIKSELDWLADGYITYTVTVAKIN